MPSSIKDLMARTNSKGDRAASRLGSGSNISEDDRSFDSPTSRSESRLDLDEAALLPQMWSLPRGASMYEEGPRLDTDFSDVCRMTVAVQRGAMLSNTLMSQRHQSNDHVTGGESAITTTPARLLSFFSGEGAVYQQYDLARQELAGGPLPRPWKAVRSKTTGKVYYFNPDTRETQWEPPLYPLHRDWAAETSPQTGSVFYVNKQSGNWQWEKPVDDYFADLMSAGQTAKEALRLWRERFGEVDLGLAGLETVPAGKEAVLKLPPIAGDDNRKPALPAPSD